MVNVGVKQVCVLAPVIFNLFLVAVKLAFRSGIPTEDDVGLNYRLDGSLFNIRRRVSVNTTSAHRQPVFVDCHSRRLGIDRQCTHSLHRNDMVYCHFELCHDCGLGCLSESLYGGCRWWRWCSCIK